MAAEKLELLGELKALGADVDARMAAHGQTAAMWAARNGRKGSLDKLAELGADLDATDDDGKSARTLLEAAAGTTTGLDDHGEALSPSRVLGDVARTDVRAATYLYRLESWLCL